MTSWYGDVVTKLTSLQFHGGYKFTWSRSCKTFNGLCSELKAESKIKFELLKHMHSDFDARVCCLQS